MGVFKRSKESASFAFFLLVGHSPLLILLLLLIGMYLSGFVFLCSVMFLSPYRYACWENFLFSFHALQLTGRLSRFFYFFLFFFCFGLRLWCFSG